MDKNFLSAEEISEYFEIPLNTIYRLSRTGKIRGIKIGKQWRYAKTDMEGILATGISPRKLPARRIQEFQEKRAYPRINCSINCIYKIEIKGIKEIKSVAGVIRNISGGGIFLNDASTNLERISIGDPIELQFKLGTKNGLYTIETDGRVVREEGTEMLIYGAGIKFRDINEDCQNKIIKYVG